jgi:putative membrane protein
MFKHVLIFLKGLAMGAADVVPGVSGGTIAFITGIYDQLLSALNAINLNTLKLLRKEGFSAFWNKIHGNFLVALFIGIFISFLSLARVFKYLLDTYPHLVWALFFGLIIGSIFLVGKMISKWNPITIVGLIIGTAISYWFTVMQPADASDSMLYIFIAGTIAICAMILPGISGSFILLLMGVYYPMLEAVSNLDFKFIAVIGGGAIIGLLSFSRLLKWTLDRYKEPTVAVLIGFLIGSLNKIWPWKATLTFRTNSHGDEVPFIEENVLPYAYENPQIGLVVLFVILGIGVILLLSKFSPEPKSE